MRIEQLTPREIVNELDKYIIGQAEAKRNVAIALRNRWRRMNASEDMKGEIIPNNILMIGPTGVGKTEIARRLAKLADAPFIKVEASKFTEVGYVGRDVESMVRDLIEQAVNMIRLRKKEELKVKAMQAVEDILLDLLIPPLVVTNSKTVENEAFNGFKVSETETLSQNEDVELNHKTREKFREKLRLGQLEDKKVEMETNQPVTANVGFIGGPQGMIDDNSLQGLQDALSGMFPKNKKKKKYTIAEARKILLDEEVSKLIDMDDVKSEAVEKCENTGIIFIDEIDKIARNGNKGTSGGDVSREGVQRDLLPIVEGTAVNTKYGVVNTDHVLFIAAGAFHFAKPSDLIPELQGRFPIRVELNSLTKEDFTKILSTPKNSLTKQYFALMQSEGVELAFEEAAIEKISEIATQINSELENIGARRLHTVMSTLLNEFLFDIPEIIPAGSKLNITAELVDKKLSNLVKNRDLSKYIL